MGRGLVRNWVRMWEERLLIGRLLVVVLILFVGLIFFSRVASIFVLFIKIGLELGIVFGMF